ncbi:MAG: hypothetical protein AAGT88_01085 [Dethiobacter sp.]
MDEVQNPVATIEMADGGVITVELDVQTAHSFLSWWPTRRI